MERGSSLRIPQLRVKRDWFEVFVYRNHSTINELLKRVLLRTTSQLNYIYIPKIFGQMKC